jgi:hypothetical protein
MHEQRQIGKPEHRARALDGMKVAKHRIEKIAVLGRAFEGDQSGFDRLDQFGRFLAIDAGAKVFLTAHAFTSLLTTESSLA